MHHTVTQASAPDRLEAQRRRSEEYRRRRSQGVVLAMVELQPAALHGLERIGLLVRGDRDPRAVADAAARFLETAPAIAAVGAALFPAEGADAE